MTGNLTTFAYRERKIPIEKDGMSRTMREALVDCVGKSWLGCGPNRSLTTASKNAEFRSGDRPIIKLIHYLTTMMVLQDK